MDSAENNASELLLRPIWDVRQNALMAFRPEVSDLKYRHGRALGTDGLTAALNVVARRDRKGETTLALLPIEAKAVQQPKKLAVFTQALGLLPEQLRSRLVIEVLSVPAGLSARELQLQLKPITSLSRGFICHAPVCAGRLRFFREAGAFAVGFDLAAERGRNEAELMKQIEAFVQRANAARLKVIGHGCHSRGLVMSSVCAGVNFLSGDAIKAPVAATEGAVRFRPHHLFGLGRPRLVATNCG